MNPLGVTLTPDGKYLITRNDDERETNFFLREFVPRRQQESSTPQLRWTKTTT